MSLSNEQRAHDIAIAAIPIYLEIQKNHARKTAADSSKNDAEVSFDIYLAYKELYETSLEAVERDFG